MELTKETLTEIFETEIMRAWWRGKDDATLIYENATISYVSRTAAESIIKRPRDVVAMLTTSYKGGVSLKVVGSKRVTEKTIWKAYQKALDNIRDESNQTRE